MVPDLQVTTSTSGTDPDPDGYSLSVDGDQGREVGVTDTLEISGLTEGDHQVSLGGVIDNCTVQGDNPRTVHIVSGSTSDTEFVILCGPPGGAVTVTTVTTGEEPDADGYGVMVDDSPAVPAAANDAVTISGLAVGSHQVTLTGIAANCRVREDNPQAVTIVADDTVAVAFTIRCPAPTVSRWTAMTSGTRFSLVDVWGASSSDVFTVGQSDNTFESNILHFDGTSWSSQLDRKDIVLNAVWGSSGSDVYAVGFDAFGPEPQVILHYDGQQWRNMTPPPADPDLQVTFESVWASSATDVFIVGSFFVNPDDAGSVLVHCDGTQCAFMGSPQDDFLNLQDIWGSSPTDVYAVGTATSPDTEGGTGTILHYDGHAWTTVFQRDGVFFQSVSGSSSNDVVAVAGDGVVFRYDGTQWRSEQSGTPLFLFGNWSSSPSNGFAVGETGVIIHSAGPGRTWTSTTVRADNLFGVWGSSASDVFAVGEGGKIFHGTP
ncbi:MAG: hypothetical protein ACJ8DC_11960 [Gemmatimonadales bacterium]